MKLPWRNVKPYAKTHKHVWKATNFIDRDVPFHNKIYYCSICSSYTVREVSQREAEILNALQQWKNNVIS